MSAPPVASRLASWLLRRCLGPPSLRRRAFRFARKLTLRLWHPPVRADYYGQSLVFPGRHDLIVLSNDLSLFNTPLRRLAQAVRAVVGQLRLLDIGANVGEGVPLVDPKPGDRFWLVEGSAAFLPFLERNVANRADVTVIPRYLGDSPAVSRGSEVVVAGTAHINSGAGGEIVFETLDRIFPEDAQVLPNLLKIDVEGHEPRVFGGGRGLLARCQPVVFMEWYPKLLLREGLGSFASLEPLLAAGYDQTSIYDNHGLPMGDIALGDRARFERLAEYSLMRDLFYFDLAVFAPSHVEMRERFRARETAFHGNGLRGASPRAL